MNRKLLLSALLTGLVLAGLDARPTLARDAGGGVRENVSQVRRLNAFVDDLLQIHRHRLETRSIRKVEKVGGYARDPGHFRDIDYIDAASARLLSRIRWENKPAGLPEIIEIYVYDDQGRLQVDYLAIFLPGYRNAPFSALINVHWQDATLSAFRQFNLFGDVLFERCHGEHSGKPVDLWLDEVELPPAPGSVPADVYRACFGAVPESAAGYEHPTQLIPGLTASGAPADTGLTHAGLARRVADLSRRIDANPHDAGLFVERGQAHFLLQVFDHAIKDFSEAIRLDASLDAAYYGRGMAYGRNRQLSQGIDDLTVYIKRNPASSLAYTKRGVRYIWMGDFERAREDLQVAVSLDSRNAEAHDDLGVALAQLGREREAIAHFERAMAIEPGYKKAHHNLAMVLFLSGDPDRALTVIDGALRIEPESRESMLLKGLILEALGRTGEAKSLRDEAEFLPESNWSERSALR